MNKLFSAIGMYLVLDGVLSMLIFKDQDSLNQIPRFVRAGIGAYLVYRGSK